MIKCSFSQGNCSWLRPCNICGYYHPRILKKFGGKFCMLAVEVTEDDIRKFKEVKRENKISH